MKYLILLIFIPYFSSFIYAQPILEGKVLSTRDSLPIEGAVVSIHGSNNKVSTNNDGKFTIPVTMDKIILNISHIGYDSSVLHVNLSYSNTITIYLKESQQMLEDVDIVSTGYQKLMRERATGSFSIVSNELFNQQVGTDILSRLSSIANSLVVDNNKSGTPQLMVRGLSTIRGPKDPLIIVDNFPYDGDISNINPNIVERITILKDASASSIWGARAANGVIVFTTKTGQFNQPTRIEFNSNLTIGVKPDLSYIPQMSSNDFIEVEQELFKRGHYNSQINSSSRPVLSPVVDLLNKVRNGDLTQEHAQQSIDRLRMEDVRDQFNWYMYRPLINQQYFLNAQGGSERFSWSSSGGYDHNKGNLGNTYHRLNLRFQNTYRPIDDLSFTTSLYYTESQKKSGRYGYNNVFMKGNSFVPYMRMADLDGSALPVARTWNQSFLENVGEGQLLNWNYYPLEDWMHQTSNVSLSDILATSSLNYQVFKGLNSTINYQYERQIGMNTNLANENSYMARNYINSFAQIKDGDVVFPVPEGGILDKSNNIMISNNVRGQLTFENTYGKHGISSIAGAEIRSADINRHQERFYGYNPNNLTTGSVDYANTYPSFIGNGASLVQNNQFLGETATRFLSYFANSAYSYDKRYIFSASARRDASNLFGLKTNDQWNPFWSVGFGWKLSNERFYNVDFLSYLNLRVTYGFSGNVDPAMVAVNTMTFGQNNSTFTGRPMAWFNNYYNPQLKWETSKMLNLAIDFRIMNDRVKGVIEYYNKKGENLFGISPTDYTTGVPPTMLRNVASMKGDGWDVELNTLNIDRQFKWRTILNFSNYQDRVEEYLITRSLASQYVSTSDVPISGIEGKPLYAIFAYKWAGLDPNTGEAQGYLNGEISKDYRAISGAGTKLEDLEYFGSAIPTRFGSLINSISYKKIKVQLGVSFKMNYWFRRSSINYTNLYNNWRGHSDFALRWQKKGDELITNVPLNSHTTNSQRDAFYEGSSVLVEKGDHVRLQYFNVSYDFNNQGNRYKNLQFFMNVNNIGLLWKANKKDIDPDYNPSTGYMVIEPINYAFGIRTTF